MNTSDKILQRAAIAFFTSVVNDAEAMEKETSLWMGCKNYLYLAKRAVKGELIDEGLASNLTQNQLRVAVRFALHKLGYHVVLKQIADQLTYDGDDRGEQGFAPPDVQKAAWTAFDIINKAAEILEKTPPT